MTHTKMVDISIEETSGVDHPAHLHEGFLVMKSADTNKAAQIMSAFQKKESTMTKEIEAVKADIAKAVVDDLKPILDSIAGAWQELRTVVESEAGDIPTPAGQDDAAAGDGTDAAAGDQVLNSAELLKSLPENVREMLEKSRDEVAKARTEAETARQTAQKAIDERLDDQAIVKSRETYKNLGIDHDVVAPVLRRLEAEQPEIAKAIRATLDSAEEQMGMSSVFSEIGTASKAFSGDAYAEATKIAKSLVEAGTVKSQEAGIAEAFRANPALYKQYTDEKAGR